MLHLGCVLLQVIFWVFWTGSGSTSLLDTCTASGGGPLGQLRPVFSLACMSSLTILLVREDLVLNHVEADISSHESALMSQHS